MEPVKTAKEEANVYTFVFSKADAEHLQYLEDEGNMEEIFEEIHEYLSRNNIDVVIAYGDGEFTVDFTPGESSSK